jgi:hypothetical protein
MCGGRERGGQKDIHAFMVTVELHREEGKRGGGGA